LNRNPQIPSALRLNGWEVGRLVLAPEYRTTPEILKSCFFMILEQFAERHPTAKFFASCSPLLARLYRRFGFSMLLKDACASGDEVFSLIHGDVDSVAAAVGLQFPAPACTAAGAIA
jgi:hypothetical protein